MKKGVIFLFLVSGLILQCAHHKEMSVLTANPGTIENCLSVFPVKPFCAVHKIEADLPFGGYGNFIGVTEVHPDTGLIRMILLSPEGVSLLDAESTGAETIINSGVAPLDKEDIAERLFENIRFIFMPPTGDFLGSVYERDGSFHCVWTKDNMRTEIRMDKERAVILDIKGRSKIVRQAVLLPPSTDGIHSIMELETKGIGNYHLRFELLQMEDAGN